MFCSNLRAASDCVDYLGATLLHQARRRTEELLDLLLDDSLECEIGSEEPGANTANILDDNFDLLSKMLFINFSLR